LVAQFVDPSFLPFSQGHSTTVLIWIENNMADGATHFQEKIFTTHMWKLKMGTNLISQREDISRHNEAQDPDLIG